MEENLRFTAVNEVCANLPRRGRSLNGNEKWSRKETLVAISLVCVVYRGKPYRQHRVIGLTEG